MDSSLLIVLLTVIFVGQSSPETIGTFLNNLKLDEKAGKQPVHFHLSAYLPQTTSSNEPELMGMDFEIKNAALCDIEELADGRSGYHFKVHQYEFKILGSLTDFNNALAFRTFFGINDITRLSTSNTKETGTRGLMMIAHSPSGTETQFFFHFERVGYSELAEFKFSIMSTVNQQAKISVWNIEPMGTQSAKSSLGSPVSTKQDNGPNTFSFMAGIESGIHSKSLQLKGIPDSPAVKIVKHQLWTTFFKSVTDLNSPKPAEFTFSVYVGTGTQYGYRLNIRKAVHLTKPEQKGTSIHIFSVPSYEFTMIGDTYDRFNVAAFNQFLGGEIELMSNERTETAAELTVIYPITRDAVTKAMMIFGPAASPDGFQSWTVTITMTFTDEHTVIEMEKVKFHSDWGREELVVPEVKKVEEPTDESTEPKSGAMRREAFAKH